MGSHPTNKHRIKTAKLPPSLTAKKLPVLPPCAIPNANKAMLPLPMEDLQHNEGDGNINNNMDAQIKKFLK